MWLPLIIAALTISQQEKPASILDTVFPRPTGNNGYEEYCRAADYANSPEIVKLSQQAQTAGKENHESRLALANACSPIFELVRNGNAKPAFVPRLRSSGLSFPQFSGFKSVAKIYAVTIYTRTATGNPASAADLLADGLTFSRKITGDTSPSYVVHAAMNSILFQDFEALMPAMSVKSCDRIIALCDDLLAQESPLATALIGERRFVGLALASAKSGNPEVPGYFDVPELRDEWKAMSPTDRERLVKHVLAAQDKCLARIKDPESTWDIDPEENRGSESLEDTLTSVYAQVMVVEGKRRTQLRLLRLHAAIQKWRWENLVLPDNLKRLPEAMTYDPVALSSFNYVSNGRTYELYSTGYKSMGPIHLRYRRAPGGGENPPPLR